MQHLSLKENAYRIIKAKLLSLEFKPGDRLREDLLAEEIAMSRTPVREAIQQLTAEGYVNNIPRKGIFVVELSKEELLDLLEVRIALEHLAVDKCIVNLGSENLQQLRDAHQRFADALKGKDFSACLEMDSAFHKQIAAIAANPRLSRFIDEIENFMLMARAVEKKADPELKNQISLDEHAAILSAIEAGDSDRAKSAISENIERMKHNLYQD